MKTKQIIATIKEMVSQNNLYWVAKHYGICKNPEHTKVDTFKLVEQNYKLKEKEGWLIPHLERCKQEDLLKIIRHINCGDINTDIVVQEMDTDGSYSGIVDMYVPK